MAKLKEEDILLNRKIAQRIKYLREEIEPIQAQFANDHNIDRQLLSRWENVNDSRGISIHSINRFCTMAGISLKQFFDSEEFKFHR